MIPDAPKDEGFYDFYIRLKESMFRVPDQPRFFRKTSHAKYIATLSSLCELVVKTGSVDTARNFISGIREKSGIVTAQFWLGRYPKYLEVLEKPPSRLSKKNLNELIHLCLELSGIIESELKIFTGLIKISKNQKADTERIRNTSLSGLVTQIKNSYNEYSVITSKFNIMTRNAIAHESYFIRYSQKMVEFDDRKKSVTLSYKDLLNYTRELSALGISLLLIEEILDYKSSQSTREFIKRVYKS